MVCASICPFFLHSALCKKHFNCKKHFSPLLVCLSVCLSVCWLVGHRAATLQHSQSVRTLPSMSVHTHTQYETFNKIKNTKYISSHMDVDVCPPVPTVVTVLCICSICCFDDMTSAQLGNILK